MKKTFLIGFIIIGFIFLTAKTEKDKYFGQKKPGLTPQIFAPDIISTDLHNHSSAVFSPDYTEVYYSIAHLSHVIIFMKRVEGKWSKPEVASFSGQYVDDNPFFSPDGKRLYYTSSRPISGTGTPSKKDNIWFVERHGKTWGKPEILSSAINQPDSDEGCPSLSSRGDLYFSSNRKGGRGSMDIYISKWVNGKFIKAENLDSDINSKYQEGWPCISPDGNLILFNLYSRGKTEEGFAVSFRTKDGNFQKPVIIKEFTYDTRMPIFSPDGKFLFLNMQGFGMKNENYSEKRIKFTELKERQNSWKNGKGNIVWLKIEFLDKYNPLKRSK